MRVISIIVLVAVLLLMCGTASAYIQYRPATNQIQIYLETTSANMSVIDAALEIQNDPTYGGPYPDVVTYNETGQYWIVNAFINLAGTVTLDISDTNVRFNNTVNQNGILGSTDTTLIIKNSSLMSVTDSSGTTANTNYATMEKIEAYNVSIEDVSFSYFDHVYVSANDKVYDKLTFVGCDSDVFLVRLSDNITVSNSEFFDSVGTHLRVYSSSNVTIHDIVSTNAGDYTSPATGRHNVVIGDDVAGREVVNFEIYNVTASGAGWSSIDTESNANTRNGYIHNCTVINSGHNAFDIHGGFNITLYDCTATDSDAENFMITSGDTSQDNTGNITLENCNSIGAAGYKVSGVNTFKILNCTATNPNVQPLSMLKALDGFISNFKSSGGTTGAVLQWDTTTNTPSRNISIINSDFGGDVELYNAYDICIVNTNNTVYSGAGNHNYTVLYPLNVRVLNTEGQPVDNAMITVTASTFSLNGFGETVTTAYTDSTGKLNESQLIYVADFLRDSSAGYTYYIVDVTASKDGETDSELAINPDATWRSSDIDNLNGTLYILILDVEGTGDPILVITDYSPADTTPEITVGNSQDFSITTSKLANISWLVDSVSQETNSSVTTDYYTYTGAVAGEHNVTAMAVNGTDLVQQSWTVTVSAASRPSTPTNPDQESALQKTKSIFALAIGLVLIAIMSMVAITLILAFNTGQFNSTIAMVVLAELVISAFAVIIFYSIYGALT